MPLSTSRTPRAKDLLPRRVRLPLPSLETHPLKPIYRLTYTRKEYTRADFRWASPLFPSNFDRLGRRTPVLLHPQTTRF